MSEEYLRRLQRMEQWISTMLPPSEKGANRWVSVQQTHRPSYVYVGLPPVSIDAQTHVLQWLATQSDLSQHTKLTILGATIDCGHFKVIEHLSGADAVLREMVCPLAALLDVPGVLKWARQGASYPWGEDTFQLAIMGGNPETLQWLRDRTPPCPWDAPYCILLTAQGGKYEEARWILEQEPSAGEDICRLAAKGGLLDALAWARKQGLPWDEDVCTGAAAGGELAALHWLRAQSPPCPWNPSRCALTAVMHEQYDTAKWVAEQDPLAGKGMCAGAAGLGLVHILEWALREGGAFLLDEDTCFGAAAYGQLTALQWLRSHECPWHAGQCAKYAVKHDRLEVAAWIVKQEPSSITALCQYAAEEGSLAVLIWANRLVPASTWKEVVWYSAARAGAKNILIWAQTQFRPCPWNALLCVFGAFEFGNTEVAEWILEQKSFVREKLCIAAASEGEVGLILWARSLNPPCPWDFQNCIEVAMSEGVSDEELLPLFELEPNVQLSREFILQVARDDRAVLFKFLLQRGCYRYVLRPGLSADLRCARIARKMLVPLDKESMQKASDVFKRQVALSAGLRKFGIFGDVAERIGVLAGLPWV